MPLSPEDEALLDDMRQREFQVKKRQRAVDVILYRQRRYRAMLVFLTAALLAVVGAYIGFAGMLASSFPDRDRWWIPVLIDGLLGAVVGVLLGQRLLRTRAGRRLLARQQARLTRAFRVDLYAARRWFHFYYEGEDIAAFVPQILFFLDGEERFGSVGEALAFARSRPAERDVFAARAMAMFRDIAACSNVVAVSSTNESGHPTSRVMRFVRTDRLGVWYVTTTAHGHRVHEFDRGAIAVVTPPTETGGIISSNRAGIRRASVSFAEIADLFRQQVPGYVDDMSEEDQERQLVYEVTLHSARVETWLDQDVVTFGGA